jgi:putative phosphoesterase
LIKTAFKLLGVFIDGASTVRLLVLSDIHGNITALRRVLKDAGKFDAAVCAGDIVGYGPEPCECVKAVSEMERGCVAGNHDIAVVTGDTSKMNVYAGEAVNINRRLLKPFQIKYLKRLPQHLFYRIEDVNVHVYHGSPSYPTYEYIFPLEAQLRADEFFRATGADLIILGHTHIPFVVELEGRTLLNPGSVGQPRDGDPRSSYALVDVIGNKIEVKNRRVKYDIGEVASRMRLFNLPEALVIRLYYGR